MNSLPTPQFLTEVLPFRIRVATSAQDLSKVVEIRAKAYARHLPHFAPTLGNPEADDLRHDAILLLAERKLDGAPVGSARLIPGDALGLDPALDDFVPPSLRGRRLLEFARLGVADGDDGQLVTAALCKASYLVGRQLGTEFGIAIARRTAASFFQRMGYDIVTGALRLQGVPVPLWMVAIPTQEFEERLRVRRHPYHRFVVDTVHPDIDTTLVRSQEEAAVA